MRVAICVLLALCFVISGHAATIHVPADQPTIQAGIDAAVDGDTVLVAPGVYVENVSFAGVALVLTTSAGAEVTTIRALDTNQATVLFSNSEPKGAEISGFTITDGGRGGIYCLGTSPNIRDNVITGNRGSGENDGGGICLRNTSGATVRGNIIHGNSSTYGSAVHVGDNGMGSQNDTICYNILYDNIGHGDIRTLGTINNLRIFNNTIVVTTWRGIAGSGTTDARNNIVVNAPDAGMSGAFVSYNCIFNCGTSFVSCTLDSGNVFQDPLFTDPAHVDYTIQGGSPCRDAGDPDPLYNDSNGTRNDIGGLAYENPIYPLVTGIQYSPGLGDSIVFSLTPNIQWEYHDTSNSTQSTYEIEVGTDANWLIAEMWFSGTVQSGSGSATYSGSPLEEHTTYFVRMRVGSALGFGGWSSSRFVVNAPSTKQVPQDFGTIQDAINASMSGDTVLVAPGVYSGDGNANINYNGRLICVRSAGGQSATTISMTGQYPEVYSFVFDSGEDSSASLSGFTIDGGSGFYGTTPGGILVTNSSPKINDCVLQRIGRESRTAFYNSHSKLERCLFRSNFCGGLDWKINVQAPTDWSEGGGAVLLKNGSNIEFADCVFENNETAYAPGGAIACYGSAMKIFASTFKGNDTHGMSMEGSGGAIYLQNSSIIAENCIVDSNQSWFDCGGAIALVNGSIATLETCVVSRNWSSRDGGGVYSNASSVTLSQCLVANNVGNIYNEYNNSGGGGIFADGHISLVECTLVRNRLQLNEEYFNANYGSAIALGSGSAQIDGSILAFNTGAGAIDCSSIESATITCSSIFGNPSGDWVGCLAGQLGLNGNISADPLFCDTANNDFHIRNSSPCAPANNSCGTLIGALGVGCLNIAPSIVSPDTTSTVEYARLLHRATVSDIDGPTLTLAFTSLPSWLNSDADSVFGTPQYGNGDTSFVIVASDGFLADTQLVTVRVQAITPLVLELSADADTIMQHMVTSHPIFGWRYFTPVVHDQDSFSIAVGTDTNWTLAEMWNPAPVNSTDTFVTYAGAPLVDGMTYYVRLQVHNGYAWSPWYQTSFRMNSVPGVPLPRTPVNDGVAGSMPILWVNSALDAENDMLYYDFAGFHDTDCVSGPTIEIFNVAGTPDSTGGQVTTALAENCRYWWRARAYDGYEYSDWSAHATFRVDGTPEPPTIPVPIEPPTPDGKPVFTMLPTLKWNPSSDPDPFDTVRYKVEMTPFLVRDSLLGDSVTVVDSLDYGTRYYWRVSAWDRTHQMVVSAQKSFWTWALGDLNPSHVCDLSDLSAMVSYLTGGGYVISPKMVGDLNGSCFVDLTDLSIIVSYLTGVGAEFKPGCE